MSIQPGLVHWCKFRYSKDLTFLLIAVYVRDLISAQLPKFLLFIFTSKYLLRKWVKFLSIVYITSLKKCPHLLAEFTFYTYILSLHCCSSVALWHLLRLYFTLCTIQAHIKISPCFYGNFLLWYKLVGW